MLTTFDVPGSLRTAILSLNDSGASAGIYTDANKLVHGFIRLANGSFTSFDAPGATKTYRQLPERLRGGLRDFLGRERDAIRLRAGRGWVVHRIQLAREPEWSRPHQQRRTCRG